MKAVLERYNFGGSVTNAFLQLNGQPQHIEVVTVNRKNGTISVALKVPEPRYEEFPSSAQGISFLVKSDKNELDIIQICVAPNTASIERDMKELRLPTGNSTGSHHREFFGSEAYEIFAWMRSNQEVGNAREDVLGRLNAPQIFGDHAAEFLQIAKEVMQMSPKLIALSGNMRRTLLIQYETRLQALATGRNHSAVTPGA